MREKLISEASEKLKDLTSLGRGGSCAVKVNQRGTFQLFLGNHVNHKLIMVPGIFRTVHLKNQQSFVFSLSV